VLGPGLDFPPALPMQGAIDDRVMDRVTQFCRIGWLHRSSDDDLPLLRFGEKGSQQLLLLFACEMGMRPASLRFIA
jgi:hypothetical protein